MSGREHRALAEQFRRTVERIVEEDGLPGAVAAYALPTGRLGVAGAGYADIEAETRMGPHFRMPAGSIGKMFVSAVVVGLVRDGAIELDAPLSAYLADPRLDALPNRDAITVRHLLSHSGGLVDHVSDADFGSRIAELMAAGDANASVAPWGLVETILDNDPLFAPGEGYGYTDTGYVLLGLIVEAVTGRPYAQVLTERILGPLELEQTTASERQAPYLATGYLAADNPFGLPTRIVEDGTMIINPAVEYTGGGLISNPADLVTWARALFGGDVLGDPLTEALTASSVVRVEGEPGRYGLGVFIDDTGLGPVYGHGGWFPGYNAMLAYYPEWDVAVAIQVNRDFGNRMSAYRDRLARLVFDVLAPGT